MKPSFEKPRRIRLGCRHCTSRLTAAYAGLLLLLALVAGCASAGQMSEQTLTPAETQKPAPTPTITFTPPVIDDRDEFAFQQNRRLGRGVNLGNALEAPNEGEWGMVLEESFFQIIKAGGFNSIRVPIRWNAHAGLEEPYTIDPAFFDRIDWVVDQALKNDLAVILNIHHYEEIMKEPGEHKARFLSIWRQIAGHYQAAPDSVFFELLNEPNGAISSSNAWNELVVEVIPEIRKTNPSRTIIVGPGDWNAIPALFKLQLPESDRNLIVTVHYYQPFNFTHQGAEWVDGMDRHLGTVWAGNIYERKYINGDFDVAVQWGHQNGRPIFLGEFGAYGKADLDSRARWTEHIARQAEARGMSWAYWEFGAGFGVYDRTLKEWVDPIYKALIPDQ